MLLRYIALSYAEGRLEELPDRTVPILLELHRLSDPDLTLEKFQQQLVAALDRDDFPKADRFVSQGLEKGALMLLLDGLDLPCFAIGCRRYRQGSLPQRRGCSRRSRPGVLFARQFPT